MSVENERSNNHPSRRGFMGVVGAAGGAAALSAIPRVRSTGAAPVIDASDAPTASGAPTIDASLTAEIRSFISPSAVTTVQGDVENADGLVNGGVATLTASTGRTAPLIVLD